ncbi:hypothetical protein BASA60_001663 [Batrachochytrium salamandrivorans]|nr:hypothetical protein BASA60_001663 [Batrachochytrium salamandrivorans]
MTVDNASSSKLRSGLHKAVSPVKSCLNSIINSCCMHSKDFRISRLHSLGLSISLLYVSINPHQFIPLALLHLKSTLFFGILLNPISLGRTLRSHLGYTKNRRRLQKRLHQKGNKFPIDIDFGGRNKVKLDIYTDVPDRFLKTPSVHGPLAGAKVIIFIYGGGWCTGSIDDMVFDVHTAIEWTFNNISSYGGDVDNISIMAHSAGAHLSVLTMIHNSIRLSQARRDSKIKCSDPSDTLSCDSMSTESSDVMHRVHGMIMISGPYDLADHVVFESSRGVDELSCLERLFYHDKKQLDDASPTQLVPACLNYIDSDEFSKNFPVNWLIIHGENDPVVPFSSSYKLYEALCKTEIDHIVLKSYTDTDHARIIFDLMVPDSCSDSDFGVELADFFQRCHRIRQHKGT